MQLNLTFYFFVSIVLVSSNFLSHLFYAIIKKYLIDRIYNLENQLIYNLINVAYVQIIKYNLTFTYLNLLEFKILKFFNSIGGFYFQI